LAAAAGRLVLVLAVDMPHMTLGLIRRLLTFCTEGVGAVPRMAGAIEPLAAVYPKAALSVAAELLGDGLSRPPAARVFAEQCEHRGLVRFLDATGEVSGAFANWNAPCDVRESLLQDPLMASGQNPACAS
jgi:molybdopterin-guanine dinucleotide biosynthesis protein A